MSSESSKNDSNTADDEPIAISQASSKPEKSSSTAGDEGSVVSQASSKTKKSSSTNRSGKAKPRKWGKVPVHAIIKKWEGAKSAEQLESEHEEKEKAGKSGSQGEDVGQFIRREIRDYEAGVNRPTDYKESERELKSEAFARGLHDSLLQTQVADLGFDMFAKMYDPYKDPIMGMSFRAVAAEEARALADTGPSISKERFSSKYWSAWRKDVMILEKVSAQDNQELPKNLTRDQIFQQKLKKLGVRGNKPNSRLPGVTFAPPPQERSEYFDHHMQGNRNDPERILEHSLKQPVPTYVKTPALMRQKNADPHGIGVSMNGGAFQRGPRVPKARPPETSGADTPYVDVPKGDPKLTSFGAGARMDPAWGVSTSGGVSYDVKGGQIGDQDEASKISFAREKREGVADSRATYPGPGEYDVPGMTSHLEKKDYSALIERIDRTEGGDYRLIPAHDMGKLGGFMQGCNRQDHILYGFCLDGQCGKRTKFERAFLQTKNHLRLGAASAEICQAAVPAEHTPYRPKKKHSNGDGKVTLETHGSMDRLRKEYDSPEKIARLRREWIEEQVPDAKIYMYPLHLAARRGDVHAIRKMAVLGLDINFTEGEREETPLQLATRGQHLEAVNAILDEFDGIVDVDKQNTNGDTALHVATRKGWRDFVEALCGADANPLLKNLNGQTPLKEAHLFSIQQMLRMQEEVFTLRKELEDTTAEAKRRAEIEKAREQGTLTLDQYMTGGVDSKGLVTSVDGQGRTTGSAGSRTSSKARPRSRILLLHEDKFDAAVDASKVNKSLFRVERKTTKLADPKKNSFVLGYWPDDDDDAKGKSSPGH